MVDGVSVPVCNLAKEQQLKACRHNFEPRLIRDIVLFISNTISIINFMTIGINGIYQGLELTKASVHDVHYLNEIKYSGLKSCALLCDKGYLSTEWQLDLSTSVNIELKTAKKVNQKANKPWPWDYKSTRKRIEAFFAQLSNQMMQKRNYAKTFEGL